MADTRRQIGTFAVLALVALRLAIGCHFFSAGLEKIDRDPHTGEYRVAFSAAPFLSMARGPLADQFHAFVPNGHDWQTLLAVPQQNAPLTPDEQKLRRERPLYLPWYERIVADWQALVDRAVAVAGLTDEQVQRVKDTFARRTSELKDYLDGEASAIDEYKHQLWRLEQWKAKPEAAGAPFQEERIAKKEAETTATAKAWVAQVDELGAALVDDLRATLPADQQHSALATELNAATTPPEAQALGRMNLLVTLLTLGVGICLLLGFFTRTAAIFGALFLVSVIATQPPWITDSEPTINQIVELAGLLVVAGTAAGRWFGLDYFSWALFSKHDESPQTHVS